MQKPTIIIVAALALSAGGAMALAQSGVMVGSPDAGPHTSLIAMLFLLLLGVGIFGLASTNLLPQNMDLWRAP